MTSHHEQLQLAQIKRFLERWFADPRFRRFDELYWEATYQDLGIDLPAEVVAYFRAFARQRFRTDNAPPKPPLVVAFEEFYDQTFADHRRRVRDCSDLSPGFRAWREQQIDRTYHDLGQACADALAHVPACIELSSGCSVGCWFCSVAAPRLDGHFLATPENKRAWRNTLAALKVAVGADARHAFLYWASDPLDNPDYETFCLEFNAVLGTFPSTTSALALKDPGRTRGLLRLSRYHGCHVNRFSVLTLHQLTKLHRTFAAEELLEVEVIPQNRESMLPKSLAGRARQPQHAEKVISQWNSSQPLTNACVSGFLINMGNRTIKLISPCNASDDTPLGYTTFAECRFEDDADFASRLQEVVTRHCCNAVT